jgi:hypothetical protein
MSFDGTIPVGGLMRPPSGCAYFAYRWSAFM